MASNNTRHTLSLNLVGNLKSKLEAISKAAKEVEEDMNKGIGSAAKYAAAWEASKLVIQKTTEVIKEGMQAFVEIEAAQGRLSDTLKRVNADTGAFRRAQNLANIAAKKYGIQVEKSLDSIRKMTDATGNATTGLNDYSLAVNIAQKENKDLTEITELLSNARKGEVGELKKLKGVTQDTVTILGKMTDAAKRGEEAVKILAKEYEGAAEATRGTSDAMKVNEEKMRQLKASAGEVAIAFAHLIGVLSYNDEITWFDKFAHGLSVWAKALEDMPDDVSRLASSLTDLTFSDGFVALEKAVKRTFSEGIPPGLALIYEISDITATRAAQKRGRGAPGNRPVTTNRAASWESGPGPQEWNPRAGFEQIADITDEQLDAEVKKRGGKTKDLVDYGNQAEGWQDEGVSQVGRGFGAALEEESQRRAEHDVQRAQWVRDEKIRAAEEEALHAQEMEELKQAAREETYNAIMAGAAGAENIAGMFIESEAAKASIRAVMETAEGIAALALPFGAGTAQAVSHFAAAAQFGIAAAMGGKSAPAGKKSAPSGGASSSANRERLDREERQPKMTNINLDFSRSVGVGPKAGRELAYEINRGLTSTGGNGRLF